MMGPIGSFLLMYRSHDMRHTRFRMLTVVNETPGFWGVTRCLEKREIPTVLEFDEIRRGS